MRDDVTNQEVRIVIEEEAMLISHISSISTHHYFVIFAHRGYDDFYDHVNDIDSVNHIDHVDHVDYDDHIENRFLGEDCRRSSSRRHWSEAGEEVEH